MEKKQYQLMCTYLKGKYFISTIYRQSSAMIEDCWYFETMVLVQIHIGLMPVIEMLKRIDGLRNVFIVDLKCIHMNRSQ
jgi:hypothetical protein